MIVTLIERVLSSLTTLPSATAWYRVAGITVATTSMASLVAATTGFVDPYRDWNPPVSILRPLSVLFFPSLLEELFWRGILLPPPSLSTYWFGRACGVLTLHVLSHPIVARTMIWPRGRRVFDDSRFLFLATIILGGATASFWVSGGSVWAAAITHGIPVILWRDFWGGEAKLLRHY